MPVFLNQERTKIGTTTGTLIAFPRELDVNDPIAGLSAELLPSGYLRCDGAVYNVATFPALGEILGTGDGCAFKQPNVELSDEQFQVPDLRSKYIKATSGSDQGVINDMTVTNANGQEIKKSGVGVTVSTNVGTTAVIDLTGQFRVPARTVTLTGNLGFTKPKSPDEEVVSALSFLPHAHYTTTYRCRTIRRAGSDVFELNYFTNASTIGVQNWFDATEEQPACKFYAQTNKWQGGAFNEGGGFGSASFEYYGICKTQCGGYNVNCLIPDGEEVVIDTTPEGPCVQKFAGIPLGPIPPTGCGPATDYTVGATYICGADGVGDDNIPNGDTPSPTAIQSFSLWMGGTAYQDGPDDYYPKGTGQFAYSGYGGGAGTWNDINDFAQDTVSLSGGSGSGAEAVVRFEAYPGGPGYGNAVNTRYKILAFSNKGTGYSAGDILKFPDVGGKNIGSAPLTGGGGISLRVDTVGQSSEDGNAEAGYNHDTCLANVVPFDTVVDNNTNVVYPQISNIVETTEAFDYESDPTEHTHTINYSIGTTNYQLNIPETFISTDGMSASVNIQPETDSKIDSLIAPFIMVDYLIKT